MALAIGAVCPAALRAPAAPRGDPEAVKAGLRAAFARLLEDEDFDGLLLAHGAPAPRGGRAQLEAFATG